VNDEQFRIFMGTPLGRYQILKLLADFSLFKQSSSRCLQAHRLVLDVIKESVTPSEQEAKRVFLMLCDYCNIAYRNSIS
jgi:hypothetical protein